MDLTIQQTAVMSVTVLLSSAVQSAVGFGYGLIVTPVLVWLGLPVVFVVTLTTCMAFLQSAIPVFHLRAEIRWQLVLKAAVIRTLFMPLGLLLLTMLAELQKAKLQQVVGALVLLAVAAQLLRSDGCRRKVHWGWMVFALGLSGVLGAMIGMAGPPVALWVLTQEWSAKESRAFVLSMWLLGAPIVFSITAWQFGVVVFDYAKIALFLWPVVACGSVLGTWLGNKLNKRSLQLLIYVILVIMALGSILIS